MLLCRTERERERGGRCKLFSSALLKGKSDKERKKKDDTQTEGGEWPTLLAKERHTKGGARWPGLGRHGTGIGHNGTGVGWGWTGIG